METHGGRHIATIFWLAAILGLEGYAIFSNLNLGWTPFYRSINFLWTPLTILCAAGIHESYKATKKLQRLGRLAAIATLLVVVALNSYSVYAAVSLQERYMGYFWLYRTPEYEAAAWTARAATD